LKLIKTILLPAITCLKESLQLPKQILLKYQYTVSNIFQNKRISDSHFETFAMSKIFIAQVQILIITIILTKFPMTKMKIFLSLESIYFYLSTQKTIPKLLSERFPDIFILKIFQGAK